MFSLGRRSLRTLAIALTLSVCPIAAFAQAPAHADVLTNYADLALAGYEDALSTAKALDAAIDALIATPSEATLQAAKDAWKAARIPYQQTEAFRFGNPSQELLQIPHVCGSLREALGALEADHEFLLAGGVFDKDQIESYIELKMTEVVKFEQTPHPVEYEMYYSA